MTDYQIARNLGVMFENATRSLNMVFDKNGIALPPSVTSFINTNYYNVETNFSTKEIIKALESNNDNEVYTVLKHLVGKLATVCDYTDENEEESYENETVKEIVQLFPYIVKNVSSANLKIKRLVYIMLLSFNHLQQDISLLSINAIQKSLTDKSAINRSLAIRCLSGIKIPAILPILLLSMSKLVKDSSPLVRSACTIAIIKCIELDIQYNMQKTNQKRLSKKKKVAINVSNNEGEREYFIQCLNDDTSTISQLTSYLDILLSDNDPKVLSCAIIAYHELYNGCFDILHNKIKNLINHVEDMDDFAISNFVDIMVDYIRLFYGKFEKFEKMPEELQDFYLKLIDLVSYSMDSNVVLSIAKCLYKIYPFMLNEIRLDRILLKLIQKDYYNDINDDFKISIALDMTLLLLNKGVVEFKPFQYHNFLPCSTDNPNIFNTKISILFKLINEENFNVIFKELKFIVEKSDFNYFFKFKILQKINKLILYKSLQIEQFSKLIRFFMNKLQFEKNELLVGEYITGLRQLIQSNLGYYNGILIKLVGRLIESYSEDIDDNKLLPNAKCSIIWLLGEFIINFNDYEESNNNIQILKNVIPDLALLLIKNFKNEGEYNVRFEILIFITKLMISDINENGKGEYRLIGNKLFKLFNFALQMSKYDMELYIRDMSRLIGSLLPNIIYFSNLSINQEVDIDEMLGNDPVLLNHCIEKCSGIDLAVLMFQLNKPQLNISGTGYDTIDEGNEVMKSVYKYDQTGNGELDAGYLEYYQELRKEGFELRDYGKYSSSLSSLSYSGGVPAKTAMASVSSSPSIRERRERSTSSVSSGGRYKLQTLDDFLGGA